jgi:hypothetical protein
MQATRLIGQESGPQVAAKARMNHVERLLNELTRLLESNAGKEDDLRRDSQRYVAAFIGRVVLREAGYAPHEEILPVLQEARSAIQKMQVQGKSGFIRIEMLSALDKAIDSARPRRFDPPKF